MFKFCQPVSTAALRTTGPLKVTALQPRVILQQFRAQEVGSTRFESELSCTQNVILQNDYITAPFPLLFIRLSGE